MPAEGKVLTNIHISEVPKARQFYSPARQGWVMCYPGICGLKARDSWNSIANPRKTRGSRTFGPHSSGIYFPALRAGLLDFGPLGQPRVRTQDVYTRQGVALGCRGVRRWRGIPRAPCPQWSRRRCAGETPASARGYGRWWVKAGTIEYSIINTEWSIVRRRARSIHR